MCIGANTLYVWPQCIAECRAVGAALRHGDTMLTQAIGLGLSRHVAVTGSTEAKQLTEEWRRFEWQRSKAMELEERLSTDLSRLQREHRSEMEMLQALLRENGVPFDPPEDWTPINAGR